MGLIFTSAVCQFSPHLLGDLIEADVFVCLWRRCCLSVHRRTTKTHVLWRLSITASPMPTTLRAPPAWRSFFTITRLLIPSTIKDALHFIRSRCCTFAKFSLQHQLNRWLCMTTTVSIWNTKSSDWATPATFFVPRDLELWPFDVKINWFSRLMVEHLYVKFGNPNCSGVWEIAWKNRQTDTQNRRWKPNHVTAVGVGSYINVFLLYWRNDLGRRRNAVVKCW